MIWVGYSKFYARRALSNNMETFGLICAMRAQPLCLEVDLSLWSEQALSGDRETTNLDANVRKYRRRSICSAKAQSFLTVRRFSEDFYDILVMIVSILTIVFVFCQHKNRSFARKFHSCEWKLKSQRSGHVAHVLCAQDACLLLAIGTASSKCLKLSFCLWPWQVFASQRYAEAGQLLLIIYADFLIYLQRYTIVARYDRRKLLSDWQT